MMLCTATSTHVITCYIIHHTTSYQHTHGMNNQYNLALTVVVSYRLCNVKQISRTSTLKQHHFLVHFTKHFAFSSYVSRQNNHFVWWLIQKHNATLLILHYCDIHISRIDFPFALHIMILYIEFDINIRLHIFNTFNEKINNFNNCNLSHYNNMLLLLRRQLTLTPK